MDGVIRIKRYEAFVIGPMMQRTQRHPVCRFIGAARLGNGENVRAIEELKLHATHGAPITIRA
jgi:hypothetical protein